jgi:hypothetical protein
VDTGVVDTEGARVGGVVDETTGFSSAGTVETGAAGDVVAVTASVTAGATPAVVVVAGSGAAGTVVTIIVGDTAAGDTATGWVVTGAVTRGAVVAGGAVTGVAVTGVAVTGVAMNTDAGAGGGLVATLGGAARVGASSSPCPHIRIVQSRVGSAATAIATRGANRTCR